MPAQNLVAVFKTYAEADEARTQLLAAGVSSADIQLSATQQDTASAQATQPAHHEGQGSERELTTVYGLRDF